MDSVVFWAKLVNHGVSTRVRLDGGRKPETGDLAREARHTHGLSAFPLGVEPQGVIANTGAKPLADEAPVFAPRLERGEKRDKAAKKRGD